MQGDPRFLPGRTSPPHPYEVGGYDFNFAAGAHYAYGAPAASDFDATLSGTKHHEFPGPLNGVEFQPSETCPKNFVIFDQTYSKSRVMFHPSLAHKFGRQSFGLNGTYAHEGRASLNRNTENYGGEYSSSQKEDTEDIDALLSSEEGEEDDVVSTGRTPGSRGGNSPDSSDSSADASRSTKLKSSSDQRLVHGGASSSGRKRDRMKKMVRTIRGIIPGGDQMESTPAVLDEAVKYLKSLKMEVKKLGVKSFNS